MKTTLTLIEKTAFLKSIGALASIPSEALAELASRTREVHLEGGEQLFNEGDPNRGTFMVVEGMVAVRMGGAVVRIARPGMAVGELFLSQGEPHTTSAAAMEHAHVLNITTEDIFDAMLDFPEFGVALVRSLSRHVNNLHSRVVELEGLLSRFHGALQRAGIEPPTAFPPELSSTADDNR